MTRVLFVNRYFAPDQSATSVILGDLAYNIVESGHTAAVIASRLRYDDESVWLPAHGAIRGVTIHRVWTTRFGRSGLAGRAIDYLSFYVTAFVALLRLARRFDYVVAKTDPPLIMAVAALACRLTGAKLVNWHQDIYPELAAALEFPALSGPAGAPLRALRGAALKAACANVAIGERMAALLAGAGADRRTLKVIPNWAEQRRIEPVAHKANALREEWGLRDKFVVGYSGNLGRAHDFATVLAAAELLRDDPDIVFLMIGAGHGMRQAEAQARARGLANVVFQPFQDRPRLSQSLGAADVHWLSLKPELEGLIVPSKAYGVLSAGRPLIAIGDPDGEVARLVKRAGCGAAIASGDAAALVQAIEAYRRDPALWRATADAARAAATTLYPRETALQLWHDLFATLAAARATDAPPAPQPAVVDGTRTI